MLQKKDIRKVLNILKLNYNHTITVLKYKTPFQLLISIMLAAQSTDVQVNKVTKRLFEQHPDAGSFLKLSCSELAQKIKTVGLYKTKAKNILAACNIIVTKFNSEVPKNREELMQLPGVGRKTANVVLSITTDFQAIAVDTHVFRVSNRIGLAKAKDVRTTEEQLMNNILQKEWSQAHHWLIWHGRKICKARNPLCNKCFLFENCVYFNNVNIKNTK